MKNYAVCWYKDDLGFMEGEMKHFKDFASAAEANKYIDVLNSKKKSGYIQLLLTKGYEYAEDFPAGTQPLYFDVD